MAHDAAPYNIIFAIIGFIIWALHFWKVGKKGVLYVPKSNSSKGRSIIRFSLFVIGVVGWLYLGRSIMLPQKPVGLSNKNIEVNDIFFVVDVSRSMLAVDFAPNRLEAAKKKIGEFIKLRPTDRIGLIIFSERIFTMLPLTTDYKLLNVMVKKIKTGPLGAGTNIGDAVGLAVGRLSFSPVKNKIIIMLTDGVSNVGTITPIQAAEEAAKKNIKIYSIGIGGNKNAKIPIGNSPFGQRYQTIPGGSIDIPTLKKMAKITGGSYFIAKDISALSKVMSEIQRLEKTKVKIKDIVVFRPQFYEYALWGIVLLLLSELIRIVGLREVV